MPTPSLDLTALEELAAFQAEGQDVIGEIAAVFITESNRRIDEVSRGVATWDQPLLKGAAHSLRGGCGTVGALRMSELALALEAADEPAAAQELLEAIVEEYARVRELLRLAEEERRARRRNQPD